MPKHRNPQHIGLHEIREIHKQLWQLAFDLQNLIESSTAVIEYFLQVSSTRLWDIVSGQTNERTNAADGQSENNAYDADTVGWWRVVIMHAASRICLSTRPRRSLSDYLACMLINDGLRRKNCRTVPPDNVAENKLRESLAHTGLIKLTINNLRLLCLVANVCRETARRPRYKYSN